MLSKLLLISLLVTSSILNYSIEPILSQELQENAQSPAPERILLPAQEPNTEPDTSLSNPAQIRRPIRECTGEYFAVVNSRGQLIRSLGAISSTNLGTGYYEVIFSQGVRSAVYVATIGSPASSGTEPTGQITVVGRVSDSRGVFLTTTNSSGTPQNRGFHLLVKCSNNTPLKSSTEELDEGSILLSPTTPTTD